MRRLLLIILSVFILTNCYGLAKHEERDREDGGVNIQDRVQDRNPLLPDIELEDDEEVPWPVIDASVCEEPLPPIYQIECDLFTNEGCDEGLACYNAIIYPEDPCQQEIYMTYCAIPGEGRQGDSCEQGCAQGYNCFVTGRGTQCLKICNIYGGEPSCPPGYICTATDMPGVGACI